MTIKKIAEQQNAGRGKIGPWDRTEIAEWASTFRVLMTASEDICKAHDRGDVDYVAEHVEHMRTSLLEVTKALAGTLVAGAPALGAELARSFLVIWGSTRTEEPSSSRAPNVEPIAVSVLSTETRTHESTGHTVDVSLLRVAYFDVGDAPTLVDALLVRRDRQNDDRRVRHFPQEANAAHFDRAAECRAQWLGVSDGPFAATRPCT